MYSAYRLEFVRVRKAHQTAPLEFEPYDPPLAGDEAA
jgi:hypothetical protein